MIYKFIRCLNKAVCSIVQKATYNYYMTLCTTDKNNLPQISASGSIINNPMNKEKIIIGIGVCIDGILQSQSGKGQIVVGDHTYVGPNSRIWSYESIKIGSHVLISHNCNIFDSNCHPVNYLDRRDDYEKLITCGVGNAKNNVISSPVVIEDDVWIGANSCIMKGVRIGARSIVAAGSVVTKSIPPDVIVAGNPAQIKRKIFNSNEDKKLYENNREVQNVIEE